MAEPVDRKVWTSSISGTSVSVIVTFGIVSYAKSRGIEIPTEVAIEITAVVGGIISFITGWLIPMAETEIKKRMTNKLILEAQQDPTSKVDLTKVIDDKLILEAQVDPASPASIPEGETEHSLKEKLDQIAVKEARGEKV